MKNNKNKKLIYWMTSGVAAVFILGVVVVGTHTLNNPNIQDPSYKIADSDQNNKENLKVELQINQIKELGSSKIDANIENISADKMSDEFKFMENIVVPPEFKLVETYKLLVRSNPDIKKYDKLHDYVISYKKDDEHDIRIAISTIGEPIRDYYADGDKTSTIGDTNLKISQYKDMYIVSFKAQNRYFDVETKGITENELVTLLKLIIK